MTLIDLGEVSPEDTAPAVPLNHRRILRAALALLCLAGLVVLAGSAPVAPPTVRLLWKQEYRASESIALDGGTVYVSQSTDGPRLAAYDLPSGKLRWVARTGREVTDYSPRPAGDVLLVPADPLMVIQEGPDGSRFRFETVRTTLALDAATGHERWRTDGNAHPAVAAGTALVTVDDEQARTVRLRLVRLRDGGEIWSRAVPRLVGWTALPDEDHPTEIATATEDGEIKVFGYADGRLRGGGQLQPGTGAGTTLLLPAGDYLAVLRDESAGETVTTVYRPDDLKPLWSAGYVIGCGDLLCSMDDSGVSGRDPLTGHPVWTAPAAGDVRVLSDDRILLGRSLSSGPSAQVADIRTGRPIGPPIAGTVPYYQQPDDSVLALRPSVRPLGRLVVVRVNIADGRQHTIGTVAGTADESQICSAIPGYLACPLTDGLEVTAVG